MVDTQRGRAPLLPTGNMRRVGRGAQGGQIALVQQDEPSLSRLCGQGVEEIQASGRIQGIYVFLAGEFKRAEQFRTRRTRRACADHERHSGKQGGHHCGQETGGRRVARLKEHERPIRGAAAYARPKAMGGTRQALFFPIRGFTEKNMLHGQRMLARRAQLGGGVFVSLRQFVVGDEVFRQPGRKFRRGSIHGFGAGVLMPRCSFIYSFMSSLMSSSRPRCRA